MALFPSGRLLGILSLGHRTLAADLAWLESIQYYGRHRLGDRRYPLAEHLFRVTTDLDPRFRNAYIFGGLVLGDDAASLPAARALFARGARENPLDWQIPFHHGFLEYLRGDLETGAIEMERASRRPGAAPYAARMAAHAFAKVGRRELAVRLWQEIAVGEDESLREVARRRLQELEEAGPEPAAGAAGGARPAREALPAGDARPAREARPVREAR